MTYEQACAERMTPRCVANEIKAHGLPVIVHPNGNVLAGFDDDNRAFCVGRDGRISGREVLEWLGY
jgi:hypothetical protein